MRPKSIYVNRPIAEKVMIPVLSMAAIVSVMVLLLDNSNPTPLGIGIAALIYFSLYLFITNALTKYAIKQREKILNDYVYQIVTDYEKHLSTSSQLTQHLQKDLPILDPTGKAYGTTTASNLISEKSREFIRDYKIEIKE